MTDRVGVFRVVRGVHVLRGTDVGGKDNGFRETIELGEMLSSALSTYESVFSRVGGYREDASRSQRAELGAAELCVIGMRVLWIVAFGRWMYDVRVSLMQQERNDQTVMLLARSDEVLTEVGRLQEAVFEKVRTFRAFHELR
ncbi:MAG: hypothetical protein OXF02_07375 [Simkaniaceae bacterium]|nr:hypothetical protein [Simkaniaceae bacterium]